MKLKLVLFCILLSSIGWAQNKISGKITDETNGEPLIGASVVAKGTTVGTVTDVDGNFSFDAPASVTALTVSYVGYAPQEIAVTPGQTAFTIYMIASNTLNDVVVVGYGTTTKKGLTGSVSKISGEQISGLPVVGLDAAMQGQAAGVLVTQNSGTPGGAISVRVRGVSSINGTNQPLYVIDGIPIVTGSLSQIGTGNQTTNALADINPADIESIEILKDAAASAIYGARANNGVVLVTTKRGKSGKTKIEFSSYTGTQSTVKKLGTITGPQYENLVNESRTNRGQSLIFSDPNNATTTNWQDQIFRDAAINNTSLSLSGGNDRTRYFASGEYLNQDGIVIGSNFQRASGKLNVDNNITDNLKISLTTTFSQTNSNRVNNDNNIYGVVSAAVLLGSHIPVFTDDTKSKYARDPNSSVENPVAAALLPTINYVTQRVLANAALEWTIIPNLVARTSFGTDLNNFRDFRFYPSTSSAGAGVGGQATENFTRDYVLINENTLRYVFNVSKLKVDAVGGLSFQNEKVNFLFAQGEKFPGNTIQTLDAASVKKNIISGATLYGINSYFGRLALTWDNKYSLSGSLRSDGSSRFGADNRFGVFPSISAAWNISDEGFFKPLRSVVSSLKFRGGVGLTGSSDISNFASRGLIGAGVNYFSSPGLYPIQLANTALSWEQKKDISGGIDIGFLKDRLLISVEPYKSYISQLLINKPVPAITGFTSLAANAAKMENTGIDIGFTAKTIQTSSFTWTTIINLAKYQNTVTDYPTPTGAGFSSWIETGNSLSSFRGYRVDGIFQNQAEIDAVNAAAKAKNGATAVFQSTLTAPGDIRFKDINGDGVIDSRDQEILGKGLPDWIGSVTNNFTYTNANIGTFDLTVFFQGQTGCSIFNFTREFSEGMNSVFGSTDAVLRRWTPDNPNTDVPRAVYGDPNGNRRNSDRWLEDGSYVRLKNLTFGYSLPQNLTKRFGIQRLRAYFSGQNLWTKTNYKGYDPEVSTFAEGSGGGAGSTAFGTDFLTYPQAKTYTFGVNVTF